MGDHSNSLSHLSTEAEALPEPLRSIAARTPARILVGRAGPAYRTATQLELRQDHAAAVDAVHEELNLAVAFQAAWKLFEVQTLAASKAEYLRRPDRGRRLGEAARLAIQTQCPREADLQVVIGDGLSAAAVHAQVPRLLPLLAAEARAARWSWGRPFLIRYCRVGILNEIGEWLDPTVVVLLIGERPGLATAQSLSAYLAYRPRLGHTDAQRNLISNIHDRGVPVEAAVRRIMGLASLLRDRQQSGALVKEALPPGLDRLPLAQDGTASGSG